MHNHISFRYSSMVFSILLLAGCSSTPDNAKTTEYRFLDSTRSFITLNDSRRNGAVVDKGYFYPKSAFSFSYRYCAKSPSHANQDIVEYQALAKRVCDANNGQLIHQESGTWCVSNANTVAEYPLFSARISSTELWADLCLDGPFVTLKVIENTNAPLGKWYDAAQVLGYQPYTRYRKLILVDTNQGALYLVTKEPASAELWNDESRYIYTNIGQIVCLYNQPEGSGLGYTYRGTVQSVSNGRVKVLATTKLKGDIRTAPALERLEWHREAYINAAANAWFVCG
ncbi:hypothetical protein [Photobacterium lipolyticum]|uniref:Uncharacterized protein n=1 Tax=Photobacterium lipolyticum TaxID=266810 RepID=A0A2T3N358_9GAMM|nr:hypothetical protein [Photobacterium lipolyticum]PSW06801.1 hypothetical protein C9I89_04570 [Photobacterium lipolyticum]